MPRKKRDIRRAYRRAGFIEHSGKGDYTIFRHPLVPGHYTVDGHDGSDAKPYDEKYLREALDKLQEAQRRQQP